MSSKRVLKPKSEWLERVVSIERVTKVVKGGKTFFWEGKYHDDMNRRDTLATELNVLADFNPIVPDNYQNCEFLMLGNLEPNIQRKVLKQLKKRPKLVVLDTMNFWMECLNPSPHYFREPCDLRNVSTGYFSRFKGISCAPSGNQFNTISIEFSSQGY